MSDGPWRVESQGYGDFWRVERPGVVDSVCHPGIVAAEARCAELNKGEAARDELLTMCRLTTKALSEYLRDGKPPEDVSFILAEAQRAIRAAEGEGA